MRLVKFVGDRDKQCHNKRGYPSKKVAKLRLKQMQNRSPDLVVYRCPHCPCFHIGHDIPKGVLGT